MRVAAMTHRRVFWVFTSSLVTLNACERDVPTDRSIGVGGAGGLSALVVGDAAAALDDSGRFIVAPPPDLPKAQISATQATEQAVAYIATFGKYLRSHYERDHGAAINLGALHPTGPIYYGHSPYEQTFPPGIHRGNENAPGPFYFVTLADAQGRPTLSVAVSAYNTDVEIRNGTLAQPVEGGNNFRSFGIPSSRTDLVGPETAATLVATATGSKILAVPELVLPAERYSPQWARWRIRLDRSVNVRREDGSLRQVSELYVRFWGGDVYVAADAQPARSRDRFDPKRNGQTSFQRAPGRALTYMPVSLNAAP